jgi:EmrB/QacA subfamily drug resistance transporter
MSQRQVIIVILAAAGGLSLAALDSTIVNTALATIVGDLGGLRAYTWVGTAYLLTSTAATPLFGKISDIYGRRRTFQVAIVVFILGSIACGLAQDMTQLVLARGIQGVGGGGLFSMAFVILGDVVAPRERGRYVGIFTSTFTVASVIGPLLGGFFVDQLTWRWIFWINIPIGILVLIVTNRTLHLPWSRQSQRVDILGATLLVAGTSSLLMGLSWSSEEYGWTAPATLGLMLAAVILGVGFVGWERRAPVPIVPLRLFRIDVVRAVAPAMVVAGAMLYGANAFLPLFLQAVTGVSATSSGLLLIPLALAVAVSATAIGRVISATGRYKVWPIAGAASMGVGFGILSFLQGTTGWVIVAMGAMVLIGAGIGAVMPTTTVAVQNAVEWSDLGAGSSLVLFLRSLGGAIGLACYGALLNAQVAGRIDPELLQRPREIRDLPDEVRSDALDVLTDGITTVFLWAVPLAVIALIFMVMMPERPLRTSSALERQSSETQADSEPTSQAQRAVPTSEG